MKANSQNGNTLAVSFSFSLISLEFRSMLSIVLLLVPEDGTGINSFVFKILPLTACSPRIFSSFSSNPMIPKIHGGGGWGYQTVIFPKRKIARC